MVFERVHCALHGRLHDARQQRPVGPLHVRAVADHPHLRMARHRQVRLRRSRGRPRRAASPSVCRSGEARTPAAHTTVAATMRSTGPSPACTSTPCSSMPTTRVPSRTSMPRRVIDRRAASRSGAGKAGQHRRARLDDHDARAGRVDGAELVAQRVARDLGQRARQLDAGRPAAHHDEGQQLVAPRRIRLAFRPLERQQHAAADRDGVLQRLQAWRMLLPLGVAEIGVPGAGRQDQVVVVDRRPVGDRHPARAPGQRRSRRPAARGRCGPAAGSTGSARRSRPARVRPWPPGTAAAGRRGGCGDRPA